jgi:small subunit ribosomal protein S6
LQEHDLATTLRDYELMVILSPEVGDDVIEGSLERLSQGVTSRGGEVVEVNHWGRRRLAYPIDRHFEGNYVVSQIKLDPAEVPGMEAALRISEEVLRHLVIRSDE